MSNRFYLACFRDNVGSNVGFHCLNGAGYSTNLDNAHVYTREEAQRKWDMAREYDQPISADHIDQIAVWKVDSQYIPSESQCTSALDEYVAYKKNRWDGNDVYFLNIKKFTTSTDFTKASVMTPEEAWELDQELYVVIPFALADKAKRRTFSKNKYNPRKMVQGAGLKMPAHIKRARRKKNNTGKNRWNCPSCGRLSWQYNPYDFDGCRNRNCKEWSAYA